MQRGGFVLQLTEYVHLIHKKAVWGGGAARRHGCMLTSVILIGVLGGIAGLVLFEAVSEGKGCSGKLHDRYHE